MDLWIELKKLQGRTLRTLGQGKLFDVVVVLSDSIVVKPHSSGRERPVARTAIEGSFRELASHGQISRSKIEDSYMPRSSAYIAAMLAELPGVSHAKNPILLKYPKK